MDHGRLVEQGEPSELQQKHAVEDLEDVFATVTGHDIEAEGRLKDVRAARRVARRLG
jgi:hypothetical protein